MRSLFLWEAVALRRDRKRRLTRPVQGQQHRPLSPPVTVEPTSGWGHWGQAYSELSPFGKVGDLWKAGEPWGRLQDGSIVLQAVQPAATARWRAGASLPSAWVKLRLITESLAVMRWEELTEDMLAEEGVDPDMVDTGGFEPWGEPCPDMPDYRSPYRDLWDAQFPRFRVAHNPWVWTARIRTVSCE